LRNSCKGQWATYLMSLSFALKAANLAGGGHPAASRGCTGLQRHPHLLALLHSFLQGSTAAAYAAAGAGAPQAAGRLPQHPGCQSSLHRLPRFLAASGYASWRRVQAGEDPLLVHPQHPNTWWDQY
jgi:hypothetical protein